MKRALVVNPLIIYFNKFKYFLNPLGVKIPLSTSKETYKPFFIIGSGRSGTTLLREILNRHSKIVIPPESYVLPKIYKKHFIYNGLPWVDYVKIITGEFAGHNEFYTWDINLSKSLPEISSIDSNKYSLRTVIDAVYKSYSKSVGKENSFWGDKTIQNTLYIDYLDKIFDKPKYVHVVRDGRDVVASFLKSKLQPDLLKAANRWNSTIDYLMKYSKKNSSRILEVKYENLVSDPEKEMRKICKFLNFSFENAMLLQDVKSKKPADINYEHHQNIVNPINIQSIGKWKSYFSASEKEEIHKLLGKNLMKLGYKIQ